MPEERDELVEQLTAKAWASTRWSKGKKPADHVCAKAAARIRSLEAELAEVREALKPTPAAIAFALPLTNEPDEEDWRIGDEACAMLACVNTDGELAAAQLCRDYRNVADFLARAILRPGGEVGG